MLSSTDTVGSSWTDPDPGWAGCAGTGPAGPNAADHHPAAPDSRHGRPDSGDSTSSVNAGAWLICKAQTAVEAV